MNIMTNFWNARIQKYLHSGQTEFTDGGNITRCRLRFHFPISIDFHFRFLSNNHNSEYPQKEKYCMIKHGPGASIVCCSALQCVAVHCSALQCVAVRCSALQCDAVPCSVPQDHAELKALDATLAAKHSVVCSKLYLYIHIYTYIYIHT